MLTKITIRNFKSLANVEVELGQVNLFVGANGSGKSNLLEALSFLSSAVDGRVDDQALLRRGARPSASELLRSSFKDTKREDPIQILATWQSKTTQMANPDVNAIKNMSLSFCSTPSRVILTWQPEQPVPHTRPSEWVIQKEFD